MGMSINEALINLESLQKDYQDFHDEVWKDESYSINAESLDVAINIMCKYQKIMNIVTNGDDTHYKLLMQIKEVVEDGNVN